MSKTVTAGMATHLGQTTTTLARCWHITRVDGTEYFLTTHDQDITIEGNKYSSEWGFNQTAIENNASMSVDNLEVIGILNNAAITDTAIRAGLFNYAEVELFLVNWSNIDHGIIKLPKGRIGEVHLTPNGLFKAELRGLTQNLSQKIVEIHTPECRADLGGSRCLVPLNPTVREDLTEYLLGTFVRINTKLLWPYTELLVNSNFESETGNPITGWTDFAGTPFVYASGMQDYNGTHYLSGDSDSQSYEARQDVDTTDYAVAIDAGGLEMEFAVGRGNTFASDTGQVIVEARTAADGFISNLYDSGSEEILTLSRWFRRGVKRVVIPATTRKIRVRLIGTLVAGTTANAVWADVELFLMEQGVTTVYPNILENSDFEWGDNTTWIETSGTMNIVFNVNGLVAHTKEWYLDLKDGVNASVEFEQIIDLVNTVGLTASEIDTGEFQADLAYWYATQNYTGDPDVARMVVDALDAVDALVGNVFDISHDSNELTSNNTWTEGDPASIVLPSGTRKLRLKIIGTEVGTITNNIEMVLDDIFLGVSKIVGTAYDIYENRIYECTTSGTSGRLQPLLDTTVGNTTMDGTLVWTTREAWTRHGEVVSVSDRRVFTVTVSDPRAVDDWFNYGVLKWETGLNAGSSMEVKDWVQSSSTITLFISMPFNVQIGDKFFVYTGCDKRLATCRDKFDNILNHRGEPYVPGQKFFTIPDAK